MTKFEKEAYAAMRSEDRVLLWMMKVNELSDFAKLMTEQDLRLLKEFLDEIHEKRKERCQ